MKITIFAILLSSFMPPSAALPHLVFIRSLLLLIKQENHLPYMCAGMRTDCPNRLAGYSVWCTMTTTIYNKHTVTDDTLNILHLYMFRVSSVLLIVSSVRIAPVPPHSPVRRHCQLPPMPASPDPQGPNPNVWWMWKCAEVALEIYPCFRHL